MEPSFVIVPIEDVIKYKKADLEAIKDSDEDDSYGHPSTCICNTTNVNYHYSIFPSGRPWRFGRQDDDNGTVWICMHVECGTADKLESEINFEAESAGISKNETCSSEIFLLMGFSINKTQLYDDILSKNDELVIKVKGTIKIYFPPPPPQLSSYTVEIDNAIHFKKADFRPLKDTKNEKICSPSYQVCSIRNVNYRFELYPNGVENEEGKKESTWLYLITELEETEKIEREFEIRIDAIDSSMKGKDTCTYSHRTGWHLCSSKNFFKKILANDDDIIVRIKGTIKIYYPSE